MYQFDMLRQVGTRDEFFAVRTLLLGVFLIYVFVEQLLCEKTFDARCALKRVAGVISFDMAKQFRLGHKTLATSVASKMKQNRLDSNENVMAAQFLL